MLYHQGQGKTLTVRYADLINKHENEMPEKTGDEIALEVIQNAGLRFK